MNSRRHRRRELSTRPVNQTVRASHPQKMVGSQALLVPLRPSPGLSSESSGPTVVAVVAGGFLPGTVTAGAGDGVGVGLGCGSTAVPFSTAHTTSRWAAL